MPKVSIESYDKDAHRNHMPEFGDQIDPNGQVIIIEISKYKLEFLSLNQLQAAISYFGSKTHPSSRLNASGGDHWEFQSWVSRLPKGIINNHNRERVLKTLKLAQNKCVQENYRAACI